MFFFPMLFWLAVIFFFMHSAQRRRARRWAMMEHGMLPPYLMYVAHDRHPEAGDRTLVEQLESRIAELEQRLDFTERLLTERRQGSSPS